MIIANIMTFGRIYDTRSFEFSVKTDNLSAGSSTSTQFRLPLISTVEFVPFNITWGDGTFNLITAFDDVNLLHQYPVAGTYNVRVRGLMGGLQFANANDRLKLLVISKVDGLIINVPRTFQGCSNMTWQSVQNVIIAGNSLEATFFGCSNFNGNISSWDVSNVTNMFATFRGATNFNQPLNSWNVSNVVFMGDMFRSATNFNQPLNSWNVSNVQNMSQMFRFANNFNGNITSWNVSNVTNMFLFFGNAIAFNQNLGSWNVSNVTNMQNMFQGSTNFNQNIGAWNVSKVINFISFMESKTAANFSAANLDSIYNGWSLRPVKPNITIDFATIKYTAASSAGRAILTDAPNNWAITDGGI